MKDIEDAEEHDEQQRFIEQQVGSQQAEAFVSSCCVRVLSIPGCNSNRRSRCHSSLLWVTLALAACIGLFIVVVVLQARLVHNGQIPLDSLISDDYKSIQGDVQFLMDFAIIGHSKTATSFMKKWFRHHPQMLIRNDEVHHLSDPVLGPAKMVEDLYTLGPIRPKMYRGYKAPNDIRRLSALNAFKKYWPMTKLIVGIRHPVKWFESYYNFSVSTETEGLACELLL
jgi:hypothetical protein